MRALIVLLLAAAVQGFSLAPAAPASQAVAMRSTAVVMAAKAAPKKAVKKVVKKAAPKKVAPKPKKVVKKVAKKAPPKPKPKPKPKPAAKPKVVGPDPIKDLFSLKAIGGAQGNVKNPFAWE